MNEWQPIETAPKDGTRIVGYCPRQAWGPEVRIVWSKGKGWKSQHGWWSSNPTHWIPLPDPPTSRASEGP